MSAVLVVGSGPSGVHLARTLIDAGHAVTLLDVGFQRPEPVAPEADFDGLKTSLADPVSYFLGEDGSGIVYPDERSRYFAHPPSKQYVFSHPRGFGTRTVNFEPLISFAAGGLAEAWTGGSYPLNDSELDDFPFDFAALAPHYAEIIGRVGITAKRDDLSKFNAWFDEYLEPVPPDPHAHELLTRYERCRSDLNTRLGFYLGRSRVAMLTQERGTRQACSELGRCLWGCPRQSIYAPSSTLAELRSMPDFTYIADAFVTHFEYENDVISAVVSQSRDGAEQRHEADLFALAAGTLCSSKIFLDSIYRHSGTVHELTGLMDNSQLVVPFLKLGRIGKAVNTQSYQFHQLALGITGDEQAEYTHGQITTLKAASVHPIAQSMPFSLRAALDVFRATHAALGAANIWLHDRRRDENTLTLQPRRGDAQTDLLLSCAPDPEDRFDKPLRTLKRALWKLGCVAPPGMTKRLPRGSSVHYAGTLPMQNQRRAFACDPQCRSYDFRNLYLADGASFPSLPAKNLTFTLMANAVRIGHSMDRSLRQAVTV